MLKIQFNPCKEAVQTTKELMNAKHENQFVETSIYKDEKISMPLSQTIYAECIYVYIYIYIYISEGT